jgi:hypothetical protein
VFFDSSEMQNGLKGTFQRNRCYSDGFFSPLVLDLRVAHDRVGSSADPALLCSLPIKKND